MCVRVAGGKGGKDRYTLLSPTLLERLRGYARIGHPRTWLFCKNGGASPVSVTSA